MTELFSSPICDVILTARTLLLKVPGRLTKFPKTWSCLRHFSFKSQHSSTKLIKETRSNKSCKQNENIFWRVFGRNGDKFSFWIIYFYIRIKLQHFSLPVPLFNPSHLLLPTLFQICGLFVHYLLFHAHMYIQMYPKYNLISWHNIISVAVSGLIVWHTSL